MMMYLLYVHFISFSKHFDVNAPVAVLLLHQSGRNKERRGKSGQGGGLRLASRDRRDKVFGT